MTKIQEARIATREISQMLKDMTPEQKVRVRDVMAAIKILGSEKNSENMPDHRKTG